MWTYIVHIYAKEVVSRIKIIYGCLTKDSTPIPVTKYHPELDDTPLLGLDDHRKRQILLGMLQWMVTIGKPELCQVVSSLRRFGEIPREGHLDPTACCFRYVKTTHDK